MTDFHFLRPDLFWLLAPFFILVVLLMRTKRSSSIWNRFCSKELLPYLLVGKSSSHRLLYALISFTLALLIFALAGPTWQTVLQNLFKTKSGLVIALDLSPSMDAADIKPSRLKRALYKINDLLNLHKEGQTALLVFAEDPFVVTPLTEDLETIKALLPALDTSIMPLPGQRISKAIAKAGNLLTQAGLTNGTVLLVTSELSTEEQEKAIREAMQHNLRISVLGVGTNESVPIPKQDGGFFTNAKGALVITTLARENLSKLAQSTRGTYVNISVDDSDIHALNASLLKTHQMHAQEDLQNPQTKWHDQGYVFVLLALPFASLLFRRGLVVIALLLIPQTLQAFSWESLWQTPDQQAEQLFQQEKYQEAKALFQDPEWQAAANYRLQDYQTAANLFEPIQTPEGLYNYATAKAKQGDLKKALEVYQLALEKQPDHEDALYNKKLIEEFLEQQSQNTDQNQQQEQQQQEQQQNQSNNQDASKGNSNDQANHRDEQGEEPQQENENTQQEQQDSEQQDAANNCSSNSSKEQQAQLQDHYREQIDEKMQQQEPQTGRELNQEEMTAEEQQRQIDDRWLQRIPDDPGRLLRRKFLYQYQHQNQGKNS